MIEIGHLPIIWHIMKSFSYYGIEEFIHALGYKSEVVKNYFLNYRQFSGNISLDLRNDRVVNHNKIYENWKIHFLETGLKTETGGELNKLCNLLAVRESWLHMVMLYQTLIFQIY